MMFRAFFHRKHTEGTASSFFGRLARSVGGNTLAIMAASLIPLAGMVGGGIDLSRMYIVKTRLQHACDAGALAGRKAMGSGTWNQQNNMPNTTAENFFKANYAPGSYGSSELTYGFSENAGKVTGTASAKIPLTLTKVLFGAVWAQANGLQTLAVTCATEMRLPNTDVMFVLDTTGSMGEIPVGDTQTKLASLKVAVKCFYEIVARLDTDATCTTGTPSGGTGSQVQIRFGFVPYSTNVNVGYLLKPEWVADKWSYQSRSPIWEKSNVFQWVQTGGENPRVENVSYANVPYQYCNDQTAATLNTHDEQVSGTNKTVTDVTYDAQGWNNVNGGTCSGTKTTTIAYFTYKQVGGKTTFKQWHYGLIPQDVSGLKNGSAWNTYTSLPLNAGGTAKTISWAGCIEERQTVRAASYWPIPSGAYDLDIDMVPNAWDPATQWGPALPGVIYTRNGAGAWNTAEIDTTLDYGNQSSFVCPTASKKLQTWPDPTTFSSYVDSLVANGNTYHDIGLIWGARLLSPTGLFANENAYTPQGGEIQRNMIFMTDGDPCTTSTNYQAYGIAWFDRRTIDPNVAPTTAQVCTSGPPITDQVNARVEALCTAIKNKNITLWVVSFGSLAASTQKRLTTCASDGKYFTATNAATLQATFKSIADQISMLRLTQ